jgi:hypothetical protein
VGFAGGQKGSDGRFCSHPTTVLLYSALGQSLNLSVNHKSRQNLMCFMFRLATQKNNQSHRNKQ